ncbi:hypothetical protein H0H93_008734 [Arthromyces matolae]|nr:hypothetical protein H0H93_008734 [Arthromyces matolae]
MMKTLALFALTPQLGATVYLIIICLIASTALSIPLPEPNDSFLVPRDVQPDTGMGTALYDRPMMQQIRSDDSSTGFPLLFPRVKAEPDDDNDVKLSRFPAAAASSSSSEVKPPQSPHGHGHSPAAIKPEKTEGSETASKLAELKKLEADARSFLEAKQAKKFFEISDQLFEYFKPISIDTNPESKPLPNPNPPLVQETAERIQRDLWDIFNRRDKRTFIKIENLGGFYFSFADSTNLWDPSKEPNLLPESLKSRIPTHWASAQPHDTTSTNPNTDGHGGKEGVPSDFLVGWQLKIIAGAMAAGFKEKTPAKYILYLAWDAERATREGPYDRKILHGLTEYLTGVAKDKGIHLANRSPQKRSGDTDGATGGSKRQRA